MVTVQEIRNAACGKDENGKAKAVSIMGAHTYYTNPAKDPDVILEETTVKPVVEITIHGNFASVDFRFDNKDDSALGMFFRTLERYLEECQFNSTEKEAVAFVTIIPFELSGKYYITGVNPVFWSLLPTATGEPLTILRVVFYADDLVFTESDMDTDAFNKLIAQAVPKHEDENDEVEDYTQYDNDLYNYGDDDEDELAGYNEIDSGLEEDDEIDELEMRNYEFSNPEKYLTPVKTEDDEDVYN